MKYLYTEKWFRYEIRDTLGPKELESDINRRKHTSFRVHFYSNFDEVSIKNKISQYHALLKINSER